MLQTSGTVLHSLTNYKEIKNTGSYSLQTNESVHAFFCKV